MSPEHLRDFGSVDLSVEILLESSEVDCNHLVPLRIVQWWMDVVDVRLETVPRSLVDELLLVRRRDHHDSVLGAELAELCFDLGEYLVAGRVSAPEDRVRLVE